MLRAACLPSCFWGAGINLDVLSVCAQQIYCVLSAIRERKKSFVFTGEQLLGCPPTHAVGSPSLCLLPC